LEYKIYVYNFADLKLVDHIETTANPKGLCALCPYSSNTVLVCPGLQRGHVRVELYDKKKYTLIPAHETNLACFALNFDGTRLATASEKGTLIRIFDTSTGAALQELRRGGQRAEIYSICFNFNSQWLAVSSDHGTVHVFALDVNSAAEDDKAVEGGEKKQRKSNPKSSLHIFKSVLPKYFGSEWSFAQFPVPDVRCIVAFGAEKNSIIVVAADGMFYKALFDPEKPGAECVQESYASFVKKPEDA